MKKIFFLLPVLPFLNSCALMFNGVNQDVYVKSMIEDSKIYIDGNYIGQEGTSIRLTRKTNHVVTVKKEGYETETINIDSNVQIGWIIFDVLFCRIGFIVDLLTGAWTSLDKTHIIVDLKKNSLIDNSKTKLRKDLFS